MSQLVKFVYNSVTITIGTPVKEENNWKLKTHKKTSYSVNGQEQSAFDYLESLKDIKFTFLTEAERVALELMWSSWACEGKSFTYTPDYVNTPGASYTVTIIGDTFQSKRIGIGVDYWNIDFTIRRVIT